jgi:hypothetical protein
MGLKPRSRYSFMSSSWSFCLSFLYFACSFLSSGCSSCITRVERTCFTVRGIRMIRTATVSSTIENQ